ncbi:hypothetical protein HW132_28895 [Brasilonema sp. CT11]|nr:hypothetical protein [Brasilonema sp. CT11]
MSLALQLRIEAAKSHVQHIQKHGVLVVERGKALQLDLDPKIQEFGKAIESSGVLIQNYIQYLMILTQTQQIPGFSSTQLYAQIIEIYKYIVEIYIDTNAIYSQAIREKILTLRNRFKY